jgi:hypothetical protein
MGGMAVGMRDARVIMLAVDIRLVAPGFGVGRAVVTHNASFASRRRSTAAATNPAGRLPISTGSTGNTRRSIASSTRR